MSWAALIHQKVRFWNITPCFILKLKTMYCNHPIIILIGGQQYLSVNYFFLLYFQMQPWEGFFSQMNSIKITMRSKLNIYSLNALLRIRIGINNFQREHVQKCVNRWCNTKKGWLREGKCKVSQKRKSRISKWPHIDFSSLSLASSKFDSFDSDYN